METTDLQLAKDKTTFIIKWIVTGGIGAMIGLILYFAVNAYGFILGGKMLSLSPELLSDEEIMRQMLEDTIYFSSIAFFSALPYGLSQWLMLKRKMRISFFWVFTYSFGLMLFFGTQTVGENLLYELPSYSIWLIIAGWAISNVTTGGIQAFLLRKQFHGTSLLIPVNLLAAIAFGLSFIIVSSIIQNLEKALLGLIIASLSLDVFEFLFAGLMHSGIMVAFLNNKLFTPATEQKEPRPAATL